MRALSFIFFLLVNAASATHCADLRTVKSTTQTELSKLIKSKDIEYGQEVHFSRITVDSLNQQFEVRIVPFKNDIKRQMIERQIETLRFLSDEDVKLTDQPENIMNFKLCFYDQERYYIMFDVLPLNLRSLFLANTSLEDRMRVYLQMVAKVKFLHDTGYVHCRVQIDSFFSEESTFRVLRLKSPEKIRPKHIACPDAQIEHLNARFGHKDYVPTTFDIARLGLSILRMEKSISGDFTSQAADLQNPFDNSFPEDGDNVSQLAAGNLPLYRQVRGVFKQLLKRMIDLDFSKRPDINEVLSTLLAIKEALYQLKLNPQYTGLEEFIKNSRTKVNTDFVKYKKSVSAFINRVESDMIEEDADGFMFVI